MNINRYAAVEIRAFGQGMQKLFEGMAEVFAAIGAEEPDRLTLEKAKWKKDGGANPAEADTTTDEGESTHENEATGAGSDGSDHAGNNDDVAAVPENDPPVREEKKAKAAEPTETTEPEEPDGTAETIGEPVKEKKPAKKGKAAPSAVSQDDITKIIVQKIKKDRSNNEKIGQLLKAYGAARVGDLHEDKYEAFITDLSAI